MLGCSRIVAFVATTDSAKARAFYEGVLGLPFAYEDEFAIAFDANGVELRIQKMPQPHTLIGWSVTSIEQAVRALIANGVVFERYPSLQHDACGVWTAPSGAKVAWLKDPDGNLLSLTQPTHS